MAGFDELKTQLEGSFVAEGAAGLEASIQINIEGLTNFFIDINDGNLNVCLLYTSPSPRDRTRSRMPSSA